MKITVKLYGTLSHPFPGYQHSQGLEIEISDGATVKDLLTLLEISESRKAVVTIEGRIVKAEDKMGEGDHVQVFEAIHGG